MNHDEALSFVHAAAAELAATRGYAVAVDGDSDNLAVRYDFSSLDVLEFVLIIENKLEIELEDENLTEEILFSASRLADYIVKLANA